MTVNDLAELRDVIRDHMEDDRSNHNSLIDLVDGYNSDNPQIGAIIVALKKHSMRTDEDHRKILKMIESL